MNGHIGRLQQPAVNGMDRFNGSPASTPTHSRNNSSTSLNTSVTGSIESDSLPKSVGDVFNGFVIAVHRKMVSAKMFCVGKEAEECNGTWYMKLVYQ